MDVRITGNSLHYLEALSAFAKGEPRKQAFERASFRYIPEAHGTYADLLSAVNSSLQGQGIWGPVRIPDIKRPIGPPPPSADPVDDEFKWGVGGDADLISMAPCSRLPSAQRWVYGGYISGFAHGVDTPRFFCAQAVARVSWNLLNIIHTAQVEKGLRLPSEATLPSYVLWHGLKISFPPQPWFLNPPQHDFQAMNELLNGGSPRSDRDGMSRSSAAYDQTAWDEWYQIHPTWRWASDFPREIIDAWLNPVATDTAGYRLPHMLRRHDGQVFAPAMALHPVKTNRN